MVIGLDIGGANVKLASTSGQALSQNFDLWKTPELLPDVLQKMLREFLPAEGLAATMTAELADCFATKAEGVESVLSSLEAAAGGTPVRVWQTGGSFLTPHAARERPLQVAAANWHALATWAGRFAPRGGALLLDIGSTTTDLIPLRDGVPCPVGLTDPTRLQSGELVYTGVRRTPLCAVAGSASYRGQVCRMAAEWFATTLDVYLTLGEIPEDADDRNTANGRPATRPAAHDRLARMFCCDRTEFTADEAHALAVELAEVQVETICAAAERVLDRQTAPVEMLILSGSGSFLARKVAERLRWPGNVRLISLGDQFSPALAECACAFAVAELASTELR